MVFLKKLFGINLIAHNRYGQRREAFDVRFAAVMSGWVVVLVSLIGGLVLLPNPIGLVLIVPAALGTASAVMLGAYRHGVPAVTFAGGEAADAYLRARALLPRRERKLALAAVTRLDQDLNALIMARRDVQTAIEEVACKDWSSPLLLEELNARKDELTNEISAKTSKTQELTSRLKAAVRQYDNSLRSAEESDMAVAAVSALTTSRRTLEATRKNSIPDFA